MATAIELLDINMKANSDLSAKQFFIVKQVTSASDLADLTSATTDRPFGVLNNAPKANQAAEIQVDGVAKVVTDGNAAAIAVGDQLGTDANGRAIKCTTPDRPLLGEAMDASTAVGTVIRVKLKPGVPFRTPA